MAKTSKWFLLTGLVVLGLGLAALAGMHFFMTPPGGLDLSRSRASANGVYQISIEPEAGELRRNELHSWVLTVKTKDGTAVEDAAVAVDGGMPQHGHGLPTSPQVTSHLGAGRYRVEEVRFNMSGWWEFSFRITSPAGDDEVTFNLVL